MALNYELNLICKHNRDGSYSTQHHRRKDLRLFAKQLRKLGYRNLSAKVLKTKHVRSLVELWQCGDQTISYSNVSDATIKNRMSHIRWWSEKVSKQNVVPRCNADLGVGKRAIARASKARALTPEIIARISSTHVRYSIRLQASFGLRREDATTASGSW